MTVTPYSPEPTKRRAIALLNTLGFNPYEVTAVEVGWFTVTAHVHVTDDQGRIQLDPEDENEVWTRPVRRFAPLAKFIVGRNPA